MQKENVLQRWIWEFVHFIGTVKYFSTVETYLPRRSKIYSSLVGFKLVCGTWVFGAFRYWSLSERCSTPALILTSMRLVVSWRSFASLHLKLKNVKYYWIKNMRNTVKWTFFDLKFPRGIVRDRESCTVLLCSCTIFVSWWIWQVFWFLQIKTNMFSKMMTEQFVYKFYKNF